MTIVRNRIAGKNAARKSRPGFSKTTIEATGNAPLTELVAELDRTERGWLEASRRISALVAFGAAYAEVHEAEELGNVDFLARIDARMALIKAIRGGRRGSPSYKAELDGRTFVAYFDQEHQDGAIWRLLVV